jgi:hypothetical protein
MIPPPPGAGVDPGAYIHVRARWVGTAMRGSVGADLPWHRVINSQGTISNLPQPGARDEQRARLEAEGVVFDTLDKVNFKVCGWAGPTRPLAQTPRPPARREAEVKRRPEAKRPETRIKALHSHSEVAAAHSSV